ncbi:hypothetical protein [uncultured Zobellia sp.]|uniref:hypothetical protein n=1 Tax=uncultured Zobellia sp. TaxID=255433 RepID=UPI00259AAC43|nr:hypothetical protein [uncultured Zobellia sp.]
MNTRPIAELYKNREKLDYSTNPIYYLDDPYQSVCFFEIYVNGFLVFKRYENVGEIGNVIPLNDVILKSGTQKVKIKLFPATDINGNPLSSLDDDTRFDFKIKMYDNKIENAQDVLVKEYFAPTTTGKKDGAFKYPDTPYYEETFTFEAEVPYTLTGWSESQDLTKMDKDQLEQEVLAFYAVYDKVIQDQDEEKWVEMVRNKEEEFLKANTYNDIDDTWIKRRIKEYSNYFDSELIKSYPLDTYEMIFAGDGRAVALKSINPENIGESAYSFGLKADVYGDGNIYEIQQFKYIYTSTNPRTATN